MSEKACLRVVILCAVALAFTIAWAMVSGCASSRHATAPVARWSPAYDADWNAACACWSFTPPTKPDTAQRTDCLEKRGYRYFATPHSPTGFATGIFYPAEYRVEWCDARALIHEFSHAVLFAKTGDTGANFSGRCWL